VLYVGQLNNATKLKQREQLLMALDRCINNSEKGSEALQPEKYNLKVKKVSEKLSIKTN